MTILTVRIIRELVELEPSIITTTTPMQYEETMRRILRFIVDHPNNYVLCAASTMDRLDTMRIDMLKRIPPQCAIYQTNRQRIRFHNGSNIEFRLPRRDGQSIKGLNPHHVWWIGDVLDYRSSIELRAILRPRS